MPENPTFVVNDRRKFTSEGELRHDAPSSESVERPASAEAQPHAEVTPNQPLTAASTAELADLPESQGVDELFPDQGADDVGADDAAEITLEETLPPGPTDEQAADALRAYEATIDRLDTAMRAANPGGERVPPMTFERLVQSLYTQALILLGGGAQAGETPRVDILGARETIDMLSVLATKSEGNLKPAEKQLLDSALFDLRLGFLEITQALARQAAQRQPGVPGGAGGFAGGGPQIVR